MPSRRSSADRRRTRVVVIGLVLVAALVLGTVGAVVQQIGGPSGSSGSSGSGGDVAGDDRPTAEVAALPAPAPGETITGPTPCPEPDGSSPRVTAFAEAPPTCIEADQAYEAVVTTSVGELRFALDAATAPIATNNLAVLAGYHFYEGQPLTAVISRTASVASVVFDPPVEVPPPGYLLPREAPADQVYVPGSLAFVPDAEDGRYGAALAILSFEGVAQLPAGLTAFGTMDAGTASATTLAAIERAGSDDGTPTDVVTIESVEVRPVDRPDSAETAAG